MQSSSDNNNYLENSARSKKIIQSIVRFSPNTYFVYASSSLIFPSQGFQFVTSDCIFNPNTDYGIAKYEVMKFIDEQRTLGNLNGSSLVLVITTHYIKSKILIPKILQHARMIFLGTSAPILHLNNIGVIRDWSSAFDVCASILNECKLQSNQDHLVGSGRYCSIKDILTSIYDTVGIDWRECVSYDYDEQEDCNICYNPNHEILHDPTKKYSKFPKFIQELTSSYIKKNI